MWAHLSAWHLRAQRASPPFFPRSPSLSLSLCGPLDVKYRRVCAGSSQLLVVLFFCARPLCVRVFSFFSVCCVSCSRALASLTREGTFRMMTCAHHHHPLTRTDAKLQRRRATSGSHTSVSVCNGVAMSAPARIKGASNDPPEPLLTLHLASVRAAHSGLAVDAWKGTPARAAATNVRKMFRPPGHRPSLPLYFSTRPTNHHPMHLHA